MDVFQGDRLAGFRYWMVLLPAVLATDNLSLNSIAAGEACTSEPFPGASLQFRTIDLHCHETRIISVEFSIGQ
jgi:hypothetical protein